MRFLSLFSGIGGFDLGFERAGMTCDTVCEIDASAQEILRRHFPHARLIDDVRKAGKETHERKSIDLICGGFPCQDVSIAGRRAGLAGERSGLWFEFARVIDELEPQWVVIENVPGLLSSNRGRDFAVIVRWLAQRGYGVAWRILDAQYFGVAQRRRRVFVVASFGDGRAAKVLFESESGAGNTPPGGEAGKDVAFSLRASPSHSGDKGDGGINTTLIPVAFGWNKSASQTFPAIVMAHGQANAEIVIDKSSCLTRNHESPIVWEMSHASEAVRVSGQVAPTLQARMGTGGNQVPLIGVRRLTPLECERLQGFPDNWTAGLSDTARYRLLGNAVAVPVAKWIGRRIVEINNG